MSDFVLCPLSGEKIYEGGGTAVADTKGNIWIVSTNEARKGIRKDAFDDTLHGVKPVMGPDA